MKFFCTSNLRFPDDKKRFRDLILYKKYVKLKPGDSIMNIPEEVAEKEVCKFNNRLYFMEDEKGRIYELQKDKLGNINVI